MPVPAFFHFRDILPITSPQEVAWLGPGTEDMEPRRQEKV